MITCVYCGTPISVDYGKRALCSKRCEKLQVEEDQNDERIKNAGRAGLFQTIRGGLMKLNLGLSDEPLPST